MTILDFVIIRLKIGLKDEEHVLGEEEEGWRHYTDPDWMYKL